MVTHHLEDGEHTCVFGVLMGHDIRAISYGTWRSGQVIYHKFIEAGSIIMTAETQCSP